MQLFELKSKSKLDKTMDFLNRIVQYNPKTILEKYGKMGVDRLSEATPKDSGLTASSWHYTIERTDYEYKLTWYNSNVNDGCNVALILQHGHGTRKGVYVQGIDYINPALQPVYQEIFEMITKEVR